MTFTGEGMPPKMIMLSGTGKCRKTNIMFLSYAESKVLYTYVCDNCVYMCMRVHVWWRYIHTWMPSQKPLLCYVNLKYT